jgi:uncharacterized protein YjbI with pentapeptide repeats
MKVIKPQQLGVLTRCFEYRRQFRLGVSVLAFVPLGSQRRLIPELAMWPAVSALMGGSPVLDAAIPKSKAEYLVVGSVHPPGGKPARQCSVMAEVGNHRKVLLVTGDRVWRSSIRASEPLPFTSMPLEWNRAFGGPMFDPNPLGRGFLPEGAGPEARELPNIEHPNTVVKAATETPEPAGFGALDVGWPVRAGLAGTHDERWLKEDYPGFARDIDWEFFNVAPRDQRFPQSFAPDTSYALHNLHPQHSHLKGRLPAVRARCFVQRAGRDVVSFTDLEESPAALTTLWFFPAIERIVMVYQAQLTVREEDASDITHLMVAAEDVEATSMHRPVEHYRDVIARRCDRSKSHLYALKDSELCPPELMGRDEAAEKAEAAATSEDLVGQRMKKRLQSEIEAARARVVALGFDPDLHGPKLPAPEAAAPTLEELPEILANLEREAEREQEKQREEQKARDAVLEPLFQELGLDYAVVRGEREHKTVGPPSFTVEAKVGELKRLIEAFKAQGMPTEHVQEIIDDPQMLKVWQHGEQQGREAYRLTAHLQSPAPANDASTTDRVRANVRERVSNGTGLAGIDLTGADLSQMQLDGVSFEGAFLEHVNLEGASLRGANLSSAVLAHARLAGCDFTKANLSLCNLGASKCASANFSDALFEGAILAQADLSEARFRGAQLRNVDLSGAVLQRATFAGASANQVTISDAVLREVDFQGATLRGCHFLKVDLEGARFRGADLEGTLFLGCTGKVDFGEARMKNVRMVEQCVFDRSVFDAADLSDANLRGASLASASLRKTILARADLTGALLAGADLRLAIAAGVHLAKADLRGARLTGANLMRAGLSSAHLEGADISHTNLYAADLARIRIDSKTRYDSTLSTKARIYPQHSPVDLRSAGRRST